MKFILMLEFLYLENIFLKLINIMIRWIQSEVILSHHFIILFLRKKVRPSLLFEIRRFVLRYRHVILLDNMFYWTAWNK